MATPQHMYPSDDVTWTQLGFQLQNCYHFYRCCFVTFVPTHILQEKWCFFFKTNSNSDFYQLDLYWCTQSWESASSQPHCPSVDVLPTRPSHVMYAYCETCWCRTLVFRVRACACITSFESESSQTSFVSLIVGIHLSSVFCACGFIFPLVSAYVREV